MRTRSNYGIIGPAENAVSTSTTSRVFSAPDQYLAASSGNWLTKPGAPSITGFDAGPTNVSVAFSAPTSTGGSPIIQYTVRTTVGGFVFTGSSSPINVTGLSPATSYTFNVTATSLIGESLPSSNSTASTSSPPTSLEYLVVAGGGSGAVGNSGNIGNGGGGAGGLKSGTVTGWSGTLSVTIGAGATSPGGSVAGTLGPNGSDSSLGGTGITTVTSLGGGSARAYIANAAASATGGSGGGGTWDTVTYGEGTAGQGNRGGLGTATGSYGGGGGGGAGAVGGASNAGGAGGIGVQWPSLSGTYYAGGGGGGRASGAGGAGGAGGGGRGSYILGVGENGTANTGGGGGGTGNTNTGSGNGGSGVVILRYPTSLSAAVATTGSPTYTVSGGYRIYKFTSSGTITF